jgi:hypothetical protein
MTSAEFMIKILTATVLTAALVPAIPAQASPTRKAPAMAAPADLVTSGSGRAAAWRRQPVVMSR